MSNPFVGEIRMFGGSFAPAGWMSCQGQSMPISENETLFQLIGTTYGGDGESTFNLPDLQGRVPMHVGNGHVIGETGGTEEVTVTVQQIPVHSHPLLATQNPGTTTNPQPNLTSNSPNVGLYIEDVTGVQLNAQAISPAGGSQPHTNIQPYLSITFIISLFGIFPPPS